MSLVECGSGVLISRRCESDWSPVRDLLIPVPSGGFLQSRPRLQERQRRLAQGAGALLDVLPQSAAQLLRPWRLLLLL